MTAVQTIEGLQEVRDLAAQYAGDRLRPHVERWDHQRAMDEDALTDLAGLGFHGMRVPESNGGLGFGLPTCVGALEEIGWGEPVAAFALLASAAVAEAAALSDCGAAWLGGLATGARTGAIPLDRAAQSVRAEPCEAGWRLHGRVGWVLRGALHDVLLLGPIASPAGPRLFAVPSDAPGVRAAGREITLGLRAARIESVELAAVTLPGEAAIAGAVDAVHTVERLGTAAVATGIARAALEHATAYADVREQFARRLREFEGIRMKLADMATHVAAARALCLAAAQAASPVAAARAKLFASETAMWVTTEAVQIFGGYGYMRDYPVEKLMRDAKATEIVTGTSEVLRESIAAGLYGR